jgi:nucleotide-binding universal stress UspA family protein
MEPLTSWSFGPCLGKEGIMELATASPPPRITFKNVLVATDLSPVSEPAVLWAKAIARRYGSELYVAHIISPAETALVPPEYWGSSQQMIEEAVLRDMNRLDADLQGVHHKMLLERGGVCQSISADIDRLEIGLLVMATHGREGLGRLIRGSIAEEVFRRVLCPVLTVGPRVTAQVIGGPEFRQILYATNFGPESLAAARYAVSLAQVFETGLTLLNVMDEENFEPPVDPQVILQNRMGRLRRLTPADAELPGQAQYRVEFGNPAEQILSLANELNAGLIVLGAKSANGHTGTATHLAAATAHTVVSHAECPVMTVRV